jgi:uncharacterized zinc-type alcohol dehydrogenase-like protein
MTIHAYAAFAEKEKLKPYEYDPGEIKPHEVEIRITYSGLCHSDIHLIDNDWGISSYPLIPGHEIVGTVSAVGSEATGLTEGTRVGVGWQCGSCLSCEWCKGGEENLCATSQPTCVGRPGGFASHIRIDNRFVYPLPEKLSSENAAPLMCAGITVYSPIRRAAEKPNRKVGIIGVGGLGHLAIQFAKAFGCEVTAFSTTPEKADEARALGAQNFVVSADEKQMEKTKGSMDFILSTASGRLEWPNWFELLRPKGQICVVGVTPGYIRVQPMQLILGQKSLRGSAIGSRTWMRDMLQFAADHNISTRTEVMSMEAVNDAIDKVRHNKARYRMVLENA